MHGDGSACAGSLAQANDITAKREDLLAVAKDNPRLLGYEPGADHVKLLCKGQVIAVIPIESKQVALAP
jgi:hypothetical protein